jgi:hypothetical protein
LNKQTLNKQTLNKSTLNPQTIKIHTLIRKVMVLGGSIYLRGSADC